MRQNMNFLEEIQTLSDRVKKTVQLIQTEEATKQAFVIPFIKMLGYDVYDPSEVVPEYVADIGIGNGGKIDYAIMREGVPIMLVECKWCGVDINNRHAIQLYRYFPGSPSRVALLTNGVIFRFFTNSEESNQMGSKPFLEIDLRDIQEPLVSELEKLTKSQFDLDALIPNAMEEESVSTEASLKYKQDLSTLLSKQLEKPSDDFVKFFATQIYSGKLTQDTLKQFHEITKDGLGDFINCEIMRRLQLVLDNTEEAVVVPSTKPPKSKKAVVSDKPSRAEISDGRSRYQVKGDKVVITSEKLKVFKTIRNAVKSVVDIKRIFYRDTGNYFTIILDDNRRKPICHLRLGPRKKYIIFFDEESEGTKVQIFKPEDINDFAERLKAISLSYDKSE